MSLDQRTFLQTCAKVFIRRYALRQALQAPYDGPFPVLSRAEKCFLVDVSGRHVNVLIDRLKPAFVDASTEDEAESTSTSPSTTPSSTTPSTPPPFSTPTFQLLPAAEGHPFSSHLIAYYQTARKRQILFDSRDRSMLSSNRLYVS